MKTYICYYSCPFCPNPCCADWECESNEMVEAESKTEARKFFNNCKQCRWMKITRIVEDKPGFSDISVTIHGETKSYATMGEAIDAIWYTDPVDFIRLHDAHALDALNQDQIDGLSAALDFESIALRYHDGLVDTIDTISCDILDTITLSEFVRESIEYAKDF